MAVDVEAVLFRLNLEAQQMGIQYLGSDPEALGDIVRSLRARRQGKPPCYAISFDPHDPLCRQCDHWDKCGLAAVSPRVDVMHPPPMEPCDLCDGDLFIELYDNGGVIRGWGCSTAGCRNTHHSQEQRRARDN
jgi:hypothetical protein